MKMFNDLDEIYKDGLKPSSLVDGAFECSVCGKIYKRKNAGERHVHEKSCFKYTDMFQKTLVEPLLYKMFELATYHDSNNRTRAPTLTRFRKSSLYTIISKFWLFCFRNNMSNATMLHYFNYLIEESMRRYNSYEIKRQYSSAIISQGTCESSLKDYRTECAKGLCSIVMSQDFYEKNSKELGQDIAFTLRALERGDITCDVLFNKIDFDEFSDRLSFAEEKQLKIFLTKIA